MSACRTMGFPKTGIPMDTPNHPNLEHIFSIEKSMVFGVPHGSPFFQNPIGSPSEAFSVPHAPRWRSMTASLGFHKWAYPNSWMVYNGKSWMIWGYPYFRTPPYIHTYIHT